MVANTYFMIDVQVVDGPDLVKRFDNYRAAQRELPVGDTGEILQEALGEFMSVLTSGPI